MEEKYQSIMSEGSNQNTTLLKQVKEEQLTQAIKISILQNTVNDRNKDIKELKEGMHRILAFIDNDEKTGTPGAIKKIAINEEKVTDIEQRIGAYDIKIKTVGGIFVLIASVATFLINFFWPKNF